MPYTFIYILYKFSKATPQKQNSSPAFKIVSSILLNPNNYYSGLNISICVDLNLNNNYYLKPY